MAPKVIFLMADYETAIPWTVFVKAGFETYFATENGTSPACDEKMLSGITGQLLGANKAAKDSYRSLTETCASFKSPEKWTSPDFSLEKYDLVFLPGGHEKGMRQIIDSSDVHNHLAKYFPSTKKPLTKSLAAICHGVQVLSAASGDDGKSIIHDVQTTALPGYMEQGIYYATRMFLGDYYKTYGSGSESVQEIVSKRLGEEGKFVNSLNPATPFVVADPKYNYLSARYPPDAEKLASMAVDLVNATLKA